MVQSTRDMCPHHLGPFYREWRNFSGQWNDSFRFYDYVCRAAELYALRENCVAFNGHAYLIFGVIGLISAVLSLFLFGSHSFANNFGYLLYKVIAGLELVHMTVMILLGARYFMDCGLYFWCQFLSAHFSSFLLNTSAEAVDCIVLFLCIERTIACLLPTVFKKIHLKLIFVAIAAAALIFSTVMNFPIIFQSKVDYNTKFGRYQRPLSSFGSSIVFRLFSDVNAVRLCVTGGFIITATCCSIAGLLRARRNQRRLSRRRDQLLINGCRPSTPIYEHVVEMCILQLCLAVPAVFNYTLLATMRILGLERVYLIGEDAFLRNLTYDQAVEEIVYFSRYHIMNSAVLTTNFLAHSFHFYLYLIFCSNLRRSFVNSCKDSVISIGERMTSLCTKL